MLKQDFAKLEIYEISKETKKPQSGFTLIELLLVISILGIVTAAAIPIFTGFQRRQVLDQGVKQVKADLRFAQRRALSSLEGKAWGLRFTSGDSAYYLLSCSSGATNCLPRSTINLSQSLRVQTSGEIVFDVILGTVFFNGAEAAGDVSVTVAFSDGSSPKTITVGLGGTVED